MIPNIDPRALKSMMERLGMKSKEISASKVIIEEEGKEIVIENPSVILIQMQGQEVFQITGKYYEKEKKEEKIEASEEDIDFVSAQTGIADRELIKKEIENCKGDLAEAIMKLKEKKIS